MQRIQRKPLSSFTVISHRNELREVIISQEISESSPDINSSKKILSIDTIEGPMVYKTSDPEILKLQDGTILKKVHRP